MKKSLYLVMIAVSLQISAFAQSTWTVDKAHSKLAFTVTHLGISDVSGHIKDFDVKITSNKADFSDAVVDLTAKLQSIDTEVEMRDNHLRSADFFDVEKYGTLTFKSTGLKAAGKNKYNLTGNLTLHGVTKPVTMQLEYRGTVVNQMNKANTAGFRVTGTIKRSDFGIGPKFPAPMISDDVEIKADGEFTVK